MIGSTRKKMPRASRGKSGIRVLWLAACIMAVVTPRLSAEITLVSRLSDARAYANAGVADAPPPSIQTDFLSATLGNHAISQAAKGGIGASADSYSHSDIVLDNSMGTLRVTGDGSGMTQAHVGGAYAEAGAKVIVLSFTLTDLSYAYSLTGQLRTKQDHCNCQDSATAKLTAGSSTVFEVTLPSVTLSETGMLPPGNYTLSVDWTASEFESPGFLVYNSVDANFTFALAPAPTPTLAPPAQALNLSTRLLVETGTDNAGIGGFIITGSVPKEVIVRALGPSTGVANSLADPTLALHGPSGFTTIINDNWKVRSDGTSQQAEIEATGIPPTNDLESAIHATLAPGAYTAILTGNGTPGTGVALVEVYDLAQGVASKLANISTRAFVSTGSDVVIAGFILGNATGNDNVIVRGLGPSLSGSGLSPVLADPTLDLFNSSGTVIQSNDNWQTGPNAAEITALGLAPTNPLESAMLATLAPGSYTARLSGVSSGTGLGLVEVYDNIVVGPTATPGPPTPTPSPTPSTGTCTENFDGVTPPALPPGWTATIVLGPPPAWATSAASPDAGPNDAFITDTAVPSDKVLDRSGVVINSAAAVLSFRNNFNTEFSDGTYWDGGVLEISSPNINGGDFLDVTDLGGSFVSGPYTGTIDTSANNPLSGRPAWSGSSGGYINTVINLGPNLNGQTIILRWRMGTDDLTGAPGWRIDTISITGASCPP